MIDILFFCMATAQYEQTVEYIDKTREAIRTLTGKNK
jgi:hypothetical protein